MNQETNSDSSGQPGEPSGKSKKIKLAVLGGGPSALTAVFHLTEDPELRERYEITVYQLGWRLGGKGASGRADYARIEEHGLHVLFGFYENFFAMIRRCYEELERPPGHPLATWRDAFHARNFGVVEDYFQGRWHPWALEFPSNKAVPGSGDPLPSGADYLSMLLQSLINLTLGWRALRAVNERTGFFNPSGRNARTGDKEDALVRFALRGLEQALVVANRISITLEQRHSPLLRILQSLRQALWPAARRLALVDETAHRFWLGIDFTIALLSGIIRDGVLLPGGFDKIDEVDLRDWLASHGAHPSTLQTPYVRTIYDAAFSYADGDPCKQQVAAGAALRALLRMGFTYKGSAYYKMQAGMGDVVFAPLYLVLKNRGVKFRFFHKVESLHPNPEHSMIERVTLTRQERLGGERQEYEPLISVKGLECWPAAPLYEQLENPDAIRHINLESYYSRLPAKVKSRRSLRAGRDFDQLLFAIPIGAVPYVCKELVDYDPRWRDMVKNVKSVQTLSFQIWIKRDLKALGWNLPRPLLSLYVEPPNTWADMSQVLEYEDWPAALQPLDVSYFTGPQQGPDLAPDPADPDNADFEQQQARKTRDTALQFMRENIGKLLPGFDFGLLVDPANGRGAERFDAQYWRSNCGPSERCTLALPGSTKYRMKAGETGYDNLVITGDWIDNGLYLACMEGAVMSGIHAARAIAGRDFPIIGEHLNAF